MITKQKRIKPWRTFWIHLKFIKIGFYMHMYMSGFLFFVFCWWIVGTNESNPGWLLAVDTQLPYDK